MNSRTVKCKAERNDHILHCEQVFDNVFTRKESKCRAVLMEHCFEAKGEQMTILQMVQQLRTKSINDITVQIICRQCKVKYLLETGLMMMMMMMINFNLLEIMSLLNVKHLGKSSNQLAFHLSAYRHLQKLFRAAFQKHKSTN